VADQSLMLRSGALPARLDYLEERTVGIPPRTRLRRGDRSRIELLTGELSRALFVWLIITADGQYESFR
jgi:hypothetical protein